MADTPIDNKLPGPCVDVVAVVNCAVVPMTWPLPGPGVMGGLVVGLVVIEVDVVRFTIHAGSGSILGNSALLSDCEGWEYAIANMERRKVGGTMSMSSV